MSKTIPLAIVATLSVTLFGGFTSNAHAVAEINVAPGMTLKGPGIAVHGYDPVAYFTAGRPTQGSAEHSLVHEGATYRFTSTDNMKTFQKNPAKYVPVFGGFCAYGVAVGAKFDGDPRFWKIVDGRLYLNLNKKIQDTWLKDIPGNLEKAEKSWTKIEHSDPATLG